jgi:hypothetical protein
MRILRYLLAIALVAVSGVAKADDFQMVVIDDDPTPIPAYLITPVFTDGFSVTLSPCKASQLFGLSPGTYLGCFTGENETGAALTSLQILIPVFTFDDQTDQPGCSPVSQDVFKTITCGFTSDNKDYFLDFSGGDLPPATGYKGDCDNDGDGGSKLNEDDVKCNIASIFTIAEAGVPANDFPDDFSAVANAPEPNSFWLMSTGVLSIGLFGAWRRRRMLCESRQ